MHNRAMATGRALRHTVSLPARTARRVKALARMRAQSTSRVLSELVERYRNATDAREAERLGDELGRALFGR